MKASASDRAFCQAMLPEVSRTFALSIEALPEPLREAVRTAYLLCRMADTAEDATGITASQRELLFDAFDGLVTGGLKQATLFATAANEVLLAADSAEGRLCAEAEAVARVFHGLPAAQQALIRPSVLTLSGGMRSYCQRAEQAGLLRLTDVADLERYCYYVAGTVGELLTGLFQAAVGPLPEATVQALHQRAVSFGVGLQLVNILKDIAEDLGRGACFVPIQVAAAHGLAVEQLLQPGHRPAALRVVRELALHARNQLGRAVEYTLLWPADNPTALGVRRFCAVPLALALATLTVVESGEDTLVPSRTPKIDRATVATVVAQAAAACGNDVQLAALLGRGTSEATPE